MGQAKQGDLVKVHYTGTLANGTVFDSSADEVLQFTIGQGQVLPGFEQAVIGMQPGEERTVTIPAEQAYGPYRPEMVAWVERSQFPAGLQLELGQLLQVRQREGQPFVVKVTELTEERVKLDANHPLAGQDLTFAIRLVEIV
ncbi:MAG: peptidylprolyl isomerase [Candidatus Binatia bacterium]|nr:peptidylprolyl isomerase [Candidatus Binatia bacterium]